jgi:Tol biopolymer transport system component
LGINSLQAQIFGRNKPQYQTFDFKKVQTPSFDIYHYLENDDRLNDLASWSEQWYDFHQLILDDTIKGQNPMILYNNHPDFQQTNAIQGAINVGTGGVTEAFKNRVIFPFAMSNHQTHHVLGHELVHAFQYNMILNGDSTSINNLANLPLWMVEGLAEYLSIGRVDPNTAMWMRDAVINDDVPALKDLNNPKYFPYRYGHAFWAFVTGLKGDQVIKPYFVETAKYGLEIATASQFNMSLDNLSELWQNGLKNYYEQFVGDKKERITGKTLIDQNNGGRLNISPQISPNGRYLLFLSEKNLFTTDIFLADARDGNIIRTVASAARAGHVDAYSYLESAATWSPNSKEFAFVAVSKGDNIIIINDVDGKTVDEFKIEGVPAFSYPAWSPDGKSIVVTGTVDGQIDLYSVNLRTKRVTQLTDDKYAELMPNWSVDGSKVVFSTDYVSYENGRTDGKWKHNLAILDMVSQSVEHLNIFQGANNLNPIYDFQENILFLSDRDGFRNLYKYDIAENQVYQMTNLLTGISGITPFAPAVSVAQSERRDRIVYSHYSKNRYKIYQADQEDFELTLVNPSEVDMTPAVLLQVNPRAPQVVSQNLENIEETAVENIFLQDDEYQPKFKLDFISGSTGVGVGTNNLFGTNAGAAGGINAIFSDILGNNQLMTTASLNGELTDFAGSIAYINRKNRISWGASISHFPFRTGQFLPSTLDELEVGENQTIPVIRDEYDIVRIFQDRVGVFAQLPFSTTMRWEAGASYFFYYDRIDRYSNIYQAIPVEQNGSVNFFRGNFIGQDRNKVEGEDGINNTNFFTLNTALVGDNSFFGIASPMQGWRYNFGATQYIGGFNLTNVNLDYRRYLRARPFTFAAQIMHEGRYGEDANQFFPIYLGFPWNVRGFNDRSIESLLQDNQIDPNILAGSKALIGKFEIRVPFTGPKQIAILPTNFLLSELALFTDAGMVWNSTNDFNRDRVSIGAGDNVLEAFSRPLITAGASLRINLFGALIVEPYYAFPILGETRGIFGLNLLPGW